jgi:hypothetical protein
MSILEPKKVGQEFGAVRSSLPLERLVPYLEKHIEGFKGPVEVKQFSVGVPLLSPVTSLTDDSIYTVRSSEPPLRDS